MELRECKEKSKVVECFSAFSYVSHSRPLSPSLALCVSPSAHTLGPFMLHDHLNLSPGGDDGSLSENSPNKLQTRCMMLCGQTGKHKRAKNNSNELKERLSKVCFQNSPAELRCLSSLSVPPSLNLSPRPLSASPPFLPLSLPHFLSQCYTPHTKCLKRK